MSLDYQALAVAAVKASANIPDFAYRGDLPLGMSWAFMISKHRDSDLLYVSNYEVIKADMETRFPGDVEVTGCSHWAVGWIDHLTIRMLDDSGEVTPAGEAMLDWKARLEDYPIADEDDYSERENEATWEGVKDVTAYVFRKFVGDFSEDIAERVFSWLSEHEQCELESSDGNGGYPSEESVMRALTSLGYKADV